MEFATNYGPTFSVLEFSLNEGEVVVAQPNSMLSMSSGIRLQARAGHQGDHRKWMGGFRNLLGGENYFTVEFRAARDGQRLTLAPEAFGEILVLPLTVEPGFYLTRGSYLASVGDCQLRVKYEGWQGWMAKKGIFLLQANGSGTVFCQTFGAIVQRDLADGESYIVDNRFVIAFSQSVKYQLVKATQSVKDSLLSGEGLVNRYTGPGTIYYQTRGRPSRGLFGLLLEAAT